MVLFSEVGECVGAGGAAVVVGFMLVGCGWVGAGMGVCVCVAEAAMARADDLVLADGVFDGMCPAHFGS